MDGCPQGLRTCCGPCEYFRESRRVRSSPAAIREGPIVAIPEDIAPVRIEAQLVSRVIGRRLTVVEEIGSTNDAVMASGHAGEPEGTAVLADRQASGRGRSGRRWASVPGLGVYTSVLLRPAVAPPQAALLTILAGVATADAIHAVSGVEALLKWPNDVLIRDRKVAGILAEMATVGARVAHVVVGIGINVRHRATDFPEEVRDAATSINAEGGPRVERGAVAAALYNALDDWYAVFCAGDRAKILAAARGRSATLGCRVAVLSGDERWDGTALDLDEDGALVVRDEGGRVRRVLAADVSIRPAGR